MVDPEALHLPPSKSGQSFLSPSLLLGSWIRLRHCYVTTALVIAVLICLKALVGRDGDPVLASATFKSDRWISLPCSTKEEGSNGTASLDERKTLLDAREELPVARERSVEDKETGRTAENDADDKAALVLQAWERTHADLLYQPSHNPGSGSSGDGLAGESSAGLAAPPPPHLQDCEALDEYRRKMDNRGANGEPPVWSVWGGVLGFLMNRTSSGPRGLIDGRDKLLSKASALRMGPYPPWVVGGEEDNLAMTRQAQRDIWFHQHPRSCRDDPNLRFLVIHSVASWHLGTGAQLAWVSGVLAIAMVNNLVLVLDKFDRADHNGCKGEDRRRMTCYFFAETSNECRERVKKLEAETGNATAKRIFTVKDFDEVSYWFPPIPSRWGEPWEEMHPTTEVKGELVRRTFRQDLRWWRAQALRYLLRFPTAQTCRLLNRARHIAFGARAAAMVARSLPWNWTQEGGGVPKEGEMERLVWKLRAPWVPRPLLSIHVRQGDKQKEMKISAFPEYMELAQRLRWRFPELQTVWLSTEMQGVIDDSASYAGWDFHYTDIPRQQQNESMHDYEASLGRERSSNNAFVNLLMAADADFFVGALGSTWCYITDVLRLTGGKARQSYLSVNKDRHW